MLAEEPREAVSWEVLGILRLGCRNPRQNKALVECGIFAQDDRGKRWRRREQWDVREA